MRCLCRAILLAATVISLLDGPAQAVPRSSSAAANVMQRQVSIHWSGISLREACRRLAATQGVAIFLDRRVDAQRSVNLQVHEQVLKEVLNQLVEEGELGVAVLPSLCYLGPREPTQELPTLLELAREQTKALPPALHRKLAVKQSLHWQRLTTPQQILKNLLQSLELQVEGLDRLEHDLWDAGELPEAPVGEQLAILLAGFDCTWRWDQNEKGIQIIPIERPVRISRSYTWRGANAAHLQQVAAQMPTASMRLDNGKVLLEGRVEDHQKLMNILADLTPPRQVPKQPSRSRSERKLYSLRFEGQPVGGVLRELARQLRLDLRVNGAASSALEQRISLDVSQVELEPLLEEIGAAAGLKIQAADGALRVTPR